ncbi:MULTISPECIES: DUF1853 family protein [Vitreoscilla]|uniref:DUF1853 family protein n=1 Tax=Vitreoscilla stercoraria TaxID=61 RepID=A0ABY4E852_VITST|nr:MULTISPECIES: DUF1853 family protein [Vitreoscilla]AUZ04329.1 hypothetical protein ADP71_05470 [Vitreoscilla sp. C1]UOO91936.1 DUF1853 family protein [Vitreoscilla stercoraria]
MNFALDALWWELKTPQVRDLASLLTAPPLWHSGVELSHRTLIGEQGFRYLLSLDERPESLLTYLQDARPQSHRLGIYAEHLLAFWLSHAPHCQLLGQNIVLQEHAKSPTLGALDYVARINDRLYHLELTCKYYAHAQPLPQQLRGIQAHDTLQSKADKLVQQLAWSRHDLFARWCEMQGIDITNIKAVTVIRGMGFWRDAAVPMPINSYAWRGVYLEKNEVWQHLEGTRYAQVMSRQLLSPLRVPLEATFESVAPLGEAVWCAQLQQRPDGFWHEISRSMRLPCNEC